MNKDKIFKLAKGFRGRAKNCIRIARERVEKALQYSYRDRRNKKRDMRSLWIQRINAGTRLHGILCLGRWKFTFEKIVEFVTILLRVVSSFISPVSKKHHSLFDALSFPWDSILLSLSDTEVVDVVAVL
ncbi:50S ribosomal protein L20 [Cucumis melo var. makuwa]|uniref:50S ribosomal protein L20 n=1 Tax=Cucumis melo var. makuwa TaxID=1194695 RepID=A0A5A7UFF4_CUCMM|nr:50S ribosomal protein L20 [Cucumis melo var. makuwa]TYJ95591.1 50S ribosomal protein L20 [Cucumis melo var. makuwa]